MNHEPVYYFIFIFMWRNMDQTLEESRVKGFPQTFSVQVIADTYGLEFFAAQLRVCEEFHHPRIRTYPPEYFIYKTRAMSSSV